MSDSPNLPSGDRASGRQSGGDADAASSPADTPKALRQCPEFRPAMLTRDLRFDTLAWWGLPLVLIGVLLAMDHAQAETSPVMWLGAGMVVAALLVMSNARGTRVLRDLPRISALIDDAPEDAEDALAQVLARRPLPRGLRTLLYHRLACLRHRQGRFDESAAVAQALLASGHKLPPAVRSNLLLLYIESRLEHGALHDAHAALMDLHRMSLPLLESLQRLWLQTRYEVAAGHDAHALAELPRRLELAELMPAPQCGLMHLLLSVAAARQGRMIEAQWLRQRADLLCSDEQRQSLALRDGVMA